MGVLINGNGNARIYAGQDADWFASIAGNVTCRTSVGNKMAAAAVDASTIGVSDGVIITKEGRRIQLDAGLVDLFEIPTGSAGVTNYYIIGYHLFTGTDGTQEAETFVRLMSSSSETITEDTFRGGASDVYVSVARVQQVGVNLGTITPLLPELSTINQINNDLAKTCKLLWTNENPSDDFEGQSVYVNMTNYKGAIIEFVDGEDCVIAMRSSGTKAKSVELYQDRLLIKHRTANCYDARLIFTDGTRIQQTGVGSAFSQTIDNTSLKPNKIYGFN